MDPPCVSIMKTAKMTTPAMVPLLPAIAPSPIRELELENSILATKSKQLDYLRICSDALRRAQVVM